MMPEKRSHDEPEVSDTSSSAMGKSIQSHLISSAKIAEAFNVASLWRDNLIQYSGAMQTALQVANDLSQSALYKSGLTIAASAIHAADFQLDVLRSNEVYLSTVAQLANSANASVRSMFSEFTKAPLVDVFQADINIAWSHQFDVAKSVGDAVLVQIGAQNHLAQLTELTTMSEALMAQVNWASIASGTALNTAYSDFSSAYEALFAEFRSSPLTVLAYPPEATQLPAVEFYRGARLLRVYGERANPPAVEQRWPDIQEDLGQSRQEQLEIRLNEINPEYLVRLYGARQAIGSDNPDRARHVSISLRELLTDVLHAIASDGDVRNWSQDAKHYVNGRPTRAARFEYVFRNLSVAMRGFINKDVEAALAFMDLLQRGAHGKPMVYSDFELDVIRARMEALLYYVLEVYSWQ